MVIRHVYALIVVICNVLTVVYVDCRRCISESTAPHAKSLDSTAEVEIVDSLHELRAERTCRSALHYIFAFAQHSRDYVRATRLEYRSASCPIQYAVLRDITACTRKQVIDPIAYPVPERTLVLLRGLSRSSRTVRRVKVDTIIEAVGV